MPIRLNRREFVKSGAAAVGAVAVGSVADARQAPTMLTPSSVRPVVLSSANGNEFKNGGPMACVETAFSRITQGEDVLDAIVAGVSLNELDPKDDSVGYGGLPNADGIVQLDASCMHGPKKRAGAVACLEGVRTPSHVARLVMERTDHHLLVGRDAQRFARQMGMTIEDDLNTDHSRKLWREWKQRTDPEHFLDPEKRDRAWSDAVDAMVAEGLLDRDHLYGTINCNAVSPKGEICGVTTTSGLAWKIPGRVGDSPILGAGLYVDGAVGAAGSTGRGEANLFNLSSFLIVELLRRATTPKDAALEALRRIKSTTVERRLLNAEGNPRFNVSFYVVNAAGEHAGVSMYPGKYAVCTEKGPQTLETTALLTGKP